MVATKVAKVTISLYDVSPLPEALGEPKDLESAPSGAYNGIVILPYNRHSEFLWLCEVLWKSDS